jgi:hypothetical protein
MNHQFGFRERAGERLVARMQMPGYNFLLAPSALSLLAGVLGLAVSALCLSSGGKDEVNAGRVGLAASTVLLALGGLLLLAAFALASPPDRRRLWRAFFRWMIVAAIMVIPTALLFGPTGGFHHHIGFGPFPFFYMVWNGEDPAPGSFQIVEGYEVWLDPIRFVIMVGVWVFVFVIVIAVAAPIPRGVGRPLHDNRAE